MPPVASGDGQHLEQAGHAVINDTPVITAGLVSEGAGNPAFSQACRANDILPAFPDLRFGFGIRFTHGLVSLFKLSPGQSRVGLPI